jgi:hypothetical protein
VLDKRLDEVEFVGGGMQCGATGSVPRHSSSLCVSRRLAPQEIEDCVISVLVDALASPGGSSNGSVVLVCRGTRFAD